MNQLEFIAKHNEKTRPKFNKELFIRHDDDMINALKNVIMSCERKSFFTIKVLDFEVIDDYDEINHILWSYEDSIINKNRKKEESEEGLDDSSKKKSSTKTKINQFDFINLKDSDIKLLKVTYYIEITEKKDGIVNDTIVVYIAMPRIVDKFYFRINGNVYSAMYQVVDASTYNNTAASNSGKKQTIIFKTMFMPIRIYRYYGTLKDINGDIHKCTYFLGNMFTKTILVMKYMFAKFGFYKTLDFFYAKGVNIVKDDIDKIDRDLNYIFPVRDMYIIVPKYIYENMPLVQSLVYTIFSVCNYVKDTPFEEMFNTNTWLKALGGEFASKDIDTVYNKGISILGSLEFIYDISTRNELQLDDENKADIYRVLRWIMFEFNSLRQKDNLDITTKKVRYADYIASLYANRLATGIYRLSDKGDKADLNTIKKAIQIPPMYLLNAISKCQLVNYKNCVNDMDAITALKFTYKGISGIGEKANAIPKSYRSIHPSHLGRVDIDSSSASDPGISGTICPLTQLYDSHFSEYTEPCSWENDVSKIIQQYKAINNKIEIVKIVNNKPKEAVDVYKECASINKSLIHFNKIVNDNSYSFNGFDLFGDGLIFCIYE